MAPFSNIELEDVGQERVGVGSAYPDTQPCPDEHVKTPLCHMRPDS